MLSKEKSQVQMNKMASEFLAYSDNQPAVITKS